MPVIWCIRIFTVMPCWRWRWRWRRLEENSHRPWTHLSCVSQKDFAKCPPCVCVCVFVCGVYVHVLRSFSTVFPAWKASFSTATTVPDSLDTFQVRSEKRKQCAIFSHWRGIRVNVAMGGNSAYHRVTLHYIKPKKVWEKPAMKTVSFMHYINTQS